MKILFKYSVTLVFSILLGISSFSQNDSQKESEIQLLIISFQQNRFSNPTKARREIEKAIKIAEAFSAKNYFVSTKVLLGEFYDDNNNTKLALSEYTEALSVAKKLQDMQGIASCEYNLGFLYYKQEGKNKKQEALFHYNKSIEYSKKANDKLLLAKSYNSASFTYYELDELEKANENSINALILFRELNKRTRMAQSYLTLARVSNKKDKFSEAIQYIDSAIFIYKYNNSELEINNAMLIKAEVYFRKKEYNKAIKIAKSVEENPKVMADQKLFALELLYLINKSMNKTSASLDYLEATKSIQDSLSQLERDKLMQSVVSEVEAKNKLEALEKEAEIQGLILKESRYLTWLLIGISVLLLLIILISFLFYRQSKLKSEREKLKLEQASIQLEQKLLRTQMNPHFIANSLAAIQGNIYKQDKEKSITYLSKFAKLMRFILESSREKEVLLEKEIISLTNYLDLQKLLLEEKLTYEIKVPEELNVDEFKIPPMLIQPFVENAIVHGIELKTKPGKVILEFEKIGEILKVIIEDNGLGREKVNEIYKKRQTSHLSFSTNITNERIDKLNTENKENISSITKDIVKNGNCVGTRVELILPLKSMY
jgi:tetratricopeptide (TPR) repeat protein